MKIIGFSAVALTIISFALWFIPWICWNIFSINYSSTDSKDFTKYILELFQTLSWIIQYMAILLIGVGLIMASNRLKTN